MLKGSISPLLSLDFLDFLGLTHCREFLILTGEGLGAALMAGLVVLAMMALEVLCMPWVMMINQFMDGGEH